MNDGNSYTIHQINIVGAAGSICQQQAREYQITISLIWIGASSPYQIAMLISFKHKLTVWSHANRMVKRRVAILIITIIREDKKQGNQRRGISYSGGIMIGLRQDGAASAAGGDGGGSGGK